MNYLSNKYDLTDFYYFTGQRYVENREPKLAKYVDVCIFPDGRILPHDKNGINTQTPLGTAIYLGDFSTMHFGNILIDYLSRLWYRDEQTTQWVYTSKFDISRNTFFTNLLSLLGIKMENVVRIDKPTCFAQLFVPERSFVHDKYILPIYSNLYEQMYNNMQQNETAFYDKIYLTRTRLKRTKEIGEKRFETFFAANGYKIIALETMPLAQQAYIMRHAKQIASIEGTHAHGVVWRECRQGGGQIILRKQKEVIPRQMMLNILWNIQTTFIDVFEEPYHGFPISHDRGPFLLRWTPQIEQFAKDNHMIIPSECRKGYLTDLMLYTLKCICYKTKHTLKHLLK